MSLAPDVVCTKVWSFKKSATQSTIHLTKTGFHMGINSLLPREEIFCQQPL